jgi:hypothetical protein
MRSVLGVESIAVSPVVDPQGLDATGQNYVQISPASIARWNLEMAAIIAA